MKSRLMAIVAMVALAAAFGTRTADAQPKGEEVTVQGEVVDLWCYLEGGDHGAEHKTCGTRCAKAGNPIGILDDAGNLYVAVGMKDHQPGKQILADKMAETVTVSGTLVRRGGIQVVYVKSVKTGKGGTAAKPVAQASPASDIPAAVGAAAVKDCGCGKCAAKGCDPCHGKNCYYCVAKALVTHECGCGMCDPKGCSMCGPGCDVCKFHLAPAEAARANSAP